MYPYFFTYGQFVIIFITGHFFVAAFKSEIISSKKVILKDLERHTLLITVPLAACRLISGKSSPMFHNPSRKSHSNILELIDEEKIV